MASTQFQRGGTHTELVSQKWSKKDYKFAFEANPLLGYIGPGDDKIVQVDKNFLKEQGDKVTFALRALLTDDGQTDDGTYTGNSEAMTFYNMDVPLHERGHSVQLAGNMTEQAAYAKLRPKGQAALREWSGMVQAADIISALSGLTTKKHIAGRITGENAVDSSSNAIETVNQTTVTKGATATRWFGGGQDSSGSIGRVADDASIDNATSNHLFGTDVIEYVHRMAIKTVNPSTGAAVRPVRPIMIDGEAWYLMLIDTLQKKRLLNDAKWKEAQLQANVRGRDNWLFNGADGVWNGVVIKTTDLLHRRTGAGGSTGPEVFEAADPCANGVTVARSLFLGAQAACLAWGKMPVWKTGYEDPPHNTKYTVHTDMIYGVKKSIFNSTEFGCIVVDTAVISD